MTSNPKARSVSAAIIGIGCIFAKSSDVKGFLHLLMRGGDGIGDPPPTHRVLNDYFDQDPKKPDHIYCNRGGFLPMVDFDPTEFGIPPHALEATDTSQLLGLLTAKQALRDAGYGEGGKTFDRDKTSVILGVTGTQELVIPLGARLGHPIWRRALTESGIHGEQAEAVVQRISDGYVGWQENSFPGLLGNVVAGRIANRLDLGGTNCVVDAACASSMGALHTALLELAAGRSDMVLTGGVDAINDAFMHMCFAKTQILSATGNIRPFSRNADGTVLGEGIGLVVLKRLEDARRDGDRIYAVIKGLGSASDGKSQSIYAPRPEGQAKALERAYESAGVSPAEVDLVEAHGTGTRVGDQVEFNALCTVFKTAGTNRGRRRCALGSVKSNIGHTKAAAGTAGLIKAALAAYHKVLPPTLKADPVDPKLDVDSSPFYINTRLRPWIASGRGPRRAGVSAFGFGGSNFHAVLEEAEPQKREITWDGMIEIVPFSGPAKQSLVEKIDSLLKGLENQSGWNALAPKAAALRHQFNADQDHRLILVLEGQGGIQSVTQACAAARALLADENPLPASLADSIHYGTGKRRGNLAFLFPGQGSQYAGMGRDWVCTFPQSLEVLEEADRAFDGPEKLTDLIYPEAELDEKALRPTWIAQPAIGAVSVAMHAALSYFGVRPDATCGHSYGELVALYAAGWLTRADLWALSVARGKLMAEAGRSGREPGTMLAVKASIHALADLIRDRKELVLANRNSPGQGVFSGSSAAVEEVREICRERGWPAVDLPVSAAFHSPFVSDACKPFGQVVQSITFRSSQIPVMSNSLGAFYPGTQEAIERNLIHQIAEPVDFIGNIDGLYDQGVRTYVEIGPKTVLSRLTKTILGDRHADILALDRSTGSKSGLLDLAAVLAKLAVLGYSVDLRNWEKPSEPGRKSRMVIPLCGANYRNPHQEKTKVSSSRTPKSGVARKAAVPTGPISKPVPQLAPASNPLPGPQDLNTSQRREAVQLSVVSTKRDDTMKPTEKSPDNKGLQAALAAVQQGLASLQSLQAQTVRAHEKFLETQSEAGRTLQAMLQSVQQLAGSNGSQAGIVVPAANRSSQADPAEVGRRIEAKNNLSWPSSLDAPPAPATSSTVLPREASIKPEIAVVSSDAEKPRAAVQTSETQARLIEIVSELTGYPGEMLGLEMDIEADLGIDSIKRVEILSALEERMPDLPKVTPDLMGTLKTLGQICDFLGASSEAPQARSSADQPVNTPAPGGEIHETLVAIVSELTGYPQEMLGLEMDIEADLGIDSIKRVEILSALEERMPDLPKVTPDLMGTLKTLGQICDFLGASCAPTQARPAPDVQMDQPEKAPSARRGEIHETLVAIVSELTGYPQEMLGLDMDIEADLGIDSIKRVEILSALEERMPDLPKVTPDLMGTLKTLGQICDFLGASCAPTQARPAPDVQMDQPEKAPSARRGEIHETLVAIVSELTGYPQEMLGLDMDIEADLGIDSIKRVEILSALEERMPDLPKVTPDLMGTLKTLGQIRDYLCASSLENDQSQGEPQPAAEHRPERHNQRIQRQIVEVVPSLPAKKQWVKPADERFIAVAGAENLGVELVRAFQQKGVAAVYHPTPETLVDKGQLAGLVLVAPLDPMEALTWAGTCGAALQQNSDRMSTCFYAVTFLDGAFGFHRNGLDHPQQGALAGLVKTAALEWPQVGCCAIDIDPAWQDRQAIAESLADEICVYDNPSGSEIGLSAAGRITLGLKAVEAENEIQINLGPGDVVLISGGARGVTAAAARALADQTGCKLALIGRSPLPRPEPDWLAGLEDEARIKKALLQHHLPPHETTPKALELAFRATMANRSVLRTLDELQAAGHTVQYYPLDVCDADAVGNAVKEIGDRLGRVSALIHGAGVLEDRLIVDKTLEQGRRVYNTKVHGLQNLLQAVDLKGLRYLVLFSSVAARMGNKGQADYAMANEVLNKTAAKLALEQPHCKVLSLNWGPWDGGMVTPALKRNFQNRGIALISLDQGTRAMLAEMSFPSSSEVEVVLGAALVDHPEGGSVFPPESKPEAQMNLSLAAKREIDVARVPVLQAHQLDGRPVVPFALITEWLAHSALHANPGLTLHGLDHLRLCKGIVLDRGGKMIRLMAGAAKRKGQTYEVDVEIRNGVQDGKEVIHSRAKAILTDHLPAAPVFKENGHFKSGTGRHSREDIYSRILFHGEDLHGIKQIIRLTKSGMTCLVSAAPKPERWMADPLRSRWIADPLVLDSAFQMAIVWCYEQMGSVCLPSYANAYRQYRERFPSEGVSAVMEIKASSTHKMLGDFTFLDTDKSVVARLEGYEAVMDKDLIRAFKGDKAPCPLPTVM